MENVQQVANFPPANRGHFDTPIDFLEVGPLTPVWASVTEVDGNNNPLDGGAYVTVQQVIPIDHHVIVRVWADNVPVPIRVKITAYAYFPN